MIDIEGLRKTEVMAALLVEAANHRGRTWSLVDAIKFTSPITTFDIRIVAPNTRGGDWAFVDVKYSNFDESDFDRVFGPGSAARAIDAVRHGHGVRHMPTVGHHSSMFRK